MRNGVVFLLNSVFVIFLFFVLAVAMRGFAGHRMVFRHWRRRPGKAARTLLIFAGLCLFAMVAFATLLERPWAPKTTKSPGTVLVAEPTNPSTSKGTGNAKAVEKRRRLLIHVIAYRSVENVRFPAHVENLVFNWPEDRQKEKSRVFSLDSTHFQVRFRPNSLGVEGSPGTTPTLVFHGQLIGHIRAGLLEASFDVPLRNLAGKISNSFILQPAESKWFSVSRSEPIRYALSVSGQFASPGETLRRIPVEEYLGRFPEGTGPRSENPGFTLTNMVWVHPFPRHSRTPGLALFQAKMFASLVLLVAAVLLSLAFQRRALAFAGWTLVAVLLVVGLDRVTLARDLSTVSRASSSAPLLLKAQACSEAGTTIFYRDTARTRLLRLADNSTIDPRIREVASRTALLDLTNRNGQLAPLTRTTTPGAVNRRRR